MKLAGLRLSRGGLLVTMHETEFRIVNMQEERFPKENFAVRFAQLAKDSPHNQKDLALQLGVAESAIVNYKRGRIPSADALLKIANHFGVTMEWLLTGEEVDGAELWVAAANSKDAANSTDDDYDALLEKVMLSLPGPDSQKAVDYTRETIRDLRAQAEVFSQHAQNLLIDAERIEEHLNSFIAQTKMVAKAAQKAARTLDARHATKKAPDRKK